MVYEYVCIAIYKYNNYNLHDNEMRRDPDGSTTSPSRFFPFFFLQLCRKFVRVTNPEYCHVRVLSYLFCRKRLKVRNKLTRVHVYKRLYLCTQIRVSCHAHITLFCVIYFVSNELFFSTM